jgi:hypothetical protein
MGKVTPTNACRRKCVFGICRLSKEKVSSVVCEIWNCGVV